VWAIGLECEFSITSDLRFILNHRLAFWYPYA
jgi:hypothetical protein